MLEAKSPTLSELARFWFRIGMISWGGMMAYLPAMEAQFEDRGWLPAGRFDEAMAVSTLIPGPTFPAVAALTGYQMRGALGAAVCMMGLLLPPTLVVSAAMLLVTPGMLTGPLAPITRGLTVSVVGVLIGISYRMAMKADRRAWRGPVLLAAITGGILADIPMAIVVIGGVLLGAVLLKDQPRKEAGK